MATQQDDSVFAETFNQIPAADNSASFAINKELDLDIPGFSTGLENPLGFDEQLWTTTDDLGDLFPVEFGYRTLDLFPDLGPVADDGVSNSIEGNTAQLHSDQTTSVDLSNNFLHGFDTTPINSNTRMLPKFNDSEHQPIVALDHTEIELLSSDPVTLSMSSLAAIERELFGVDVDDNEREKTSTRRSEGPVTDLRTKATKASKAYIPQ
jgi:hypothetical protein